MFPGPIVVLAAGVPALYMPGLGMFVDWAELGFQSWRPGLSVSVCLSLSRYLVSQRHL